MRGSSYQRREAMCLHAAREPIAVLRAAQGLDAAPIAFAAQYQQDPVPADRAT